MTTYTSEPGTRLGGRYRLEDRTAAGSGWDAWKAIDETLARAVTVFTFAQGFPRIADVVTAARAASRLTDSRLAQVFDVEDAWDHAYIVMEWAGGESLGDMLSAGPLEPASGARIIAEAAAALSSAHAAGLAHMCLSPASVKWSQTGEVKVIGLGVEAALSGVTSDEPVLADTHGLGNLLYAALTGCWPGVDYQELPQAPLADGQPLSPRQVIAGIPATFSDLACGAMQLSSHSSHSPQEGSPATTTPGELSKALFAILPPAPIPSAPPPPARRERTAEYDADPYWPGRKRNDAYDDYPSSGYRPTGYEETGWQRGPTPYPVEIPAREQPERPGRRPEPGGHRAPGGHGRHDQRVLPFLPGKKVPLAIMAGIGALVAVAGITAVALWPGGSKPPASQTKAGITAPAAVIASLTPVRATGFDPLTSQKLDPYNENSQDAGLAIDDSPQTAWTTQWYKTAEFGGLKAGSGLLVEMPKAETYRSVVVTFGSTPGSNVEILVGNSDARSAANLDSMTTVATADNVSGQVTFRITSSATGRFLVIWFTKLAPMPGRAHWYDGQIFNLVVRGIG
jgi:hypothetical protein